MKSVRMLSWNVNGLRAATDKGFKRFVEKGNPDILCIQEIKLQEGQVDLHFGGYYDYWSYAERKGYAGTAIFTKNQDNIHGGVICSMQEKRILDGVLIISAYQI